MNKHPDQKQLEVGGIYNITRYSILERSQGRTLEAGTEGGAMQKCCFLIAIHGLLHLLYMQPRQAHLPRVALPTAGLHQSLIKEMPCGLAHRPI